jgi:hypothetical protein
MRATEKEPFITQTQSRLVMHEIRGKHPTTAKISPAIAVNGWYKVLCDTVYGFYMSRQNDRWYAKKERQNYYGWYKAIKRWVTDWEWATIFDHGTPNVLVTASEPSCSRSNIIWGRTNAWYLKGNAINQHGVYTNEERKAVWTIVNIETALNVKCMRKASGGIVIVLVGNWIGHNSVSHQ